jgi:hypothetical protein
MGQQRLLASPLPLVLLISGVVLSTLARAERQRAPRFERVYQLAPGESVFAYSRIFPSGRMLAYSSQALAKVDATRTVTVVDLVTKRVVFRKPGMTHTGPRGRQNDLPEFGGYTISVDLGSEHRTRLTRVGHRPESVANTTGRSSLRTNAR